MLRDAQVENSSYVSGVMQTHVDLQMFLKGDIHLVDHFNIIDDNCLIFDYL